MNNHTFTPDTYGTSEEPERLAWMRGYLEYLGIWTGFPNSTSAKLSNLYRYGQRLEQAYSLIIELEENGMALDKLKKLVYCLPTRVCKILANTWVSKGKIEQAEMVMPFLFRTDLEGLIDNAISNKVDDFFDKYAPAHANSQSLQHITRAIAHDNAHAGCWLLANTQRDLLDIFREIKSPGDRAKLDVWWAAGLDDGSIPRPARTRAMKLWLKRLPSVNSYLRRAELTDLADIHAQGRVERKARTM